MKSVKIIFLIVFLLGHLTVAGQVSDSLTRKTILKKSIFPATLILVGIIANNSQFEQNFQINLRNKVGNDFQFKIDDYLQFAPIFEMYLADALKVKAKNHWFDQTKYLLISTLISAGITQGFKHLIQKTRPDGSSYSFPSGHTTFAVRNATVLYHEFRETAPVLAYSGYVFSATTGAFRMINNKHWLSDVLAGAGLGILVANLVYHFEPFKNFNPFKKVKNVSFIPRINNQQYGFYFSYSF